MQKISVGTILEACSICRKAGTYLRLIIDVRLCLL